MLVFPWFCKCFYTSLSREKDVSCSEEFISCRPRRDWFRASSGIDTAESIVESIKLVCKQEAEAPGSKASSYSLFLDNFGYSHLGGNLIIPTKEREQCFVSLHCSCKLINLFLSLPAIWIAGKSQNFPLIKDSSGLVCLDVIRNSMIWKIWVLSEVDP